MLDNKDVIVEGIAYLDKLEKVNFDNSKLGSEVLYNFACLGIESVLTGVLMIHNRMVDHSAISNMVRELSKIEEVNPEWLTEARFMNRFQSYCSLEPIPAKIPSVDDLKRISIFATSVRDYGVSFCNN